MPANPVDRRLFLSTMPAGPGQRRLALAVVLVSLGFLLAAAPFARLQLAPLPAFIPIVASTLVINDLITAVLLLGQFRFLRSRALLALASAYLFTACMTVAHALTFPGLFSPSGLLGAGEQSTAWLYIFWHSGFPLLVVAYAFLKDDGPAKRLPRGRARGAALASVAAVLAVAGGLVFFATALHAALPAVMEGNRIAPLGFTVLGSSWLLSVAALAVLWWRRPHSVLDLWLMVVLCAWVCDIALSAVLNGGRYDLGFYAGRVFGLLAASFVLVVLLLESSVLHAEVVAARESERHQAEGALAKHEERLRILHEIDRAIVGEVPPQEIAGAMIQPLRALLGVPRAAVNVFDFAAGEFEWLAAAGRRRTHVGPGVRYPMRLMGDVEALKRGEPQVIDTRALPPGPEVDALVASDVGAYMAVPMISGGDLIGALSFGGAARAFPPEQVGIAREVATQLAIAITQARLLGRVTRHAGELEAANLQLRESERRFSDLLGNVQLISVMLDREARITYCNEYLLRLTGWRHDEVIGRSWLELFIPPESAGVKDRLAVLFADRPEGRHGDNQILTRAGERRLIRWNNSVLRSGAGDVIGLASIGEDITERTRAEQEIQDLNASLERRVAERTAQLEAANKELESFSYSVSHDLRAPLRAIDGFSRIVEEDYAGKLDAEGQRLLGVIRGNSQKMAQLIDDLLAYSRMSRNPVSSTEIDMKHLCVEALDGLRASGERLDGVVLKPLPPAQGDATLVKQALTNLLANAIKFSGKRAQPAIEVSGGDYGTQCVYCVKDNGAGFDMKYYGKLFGVFQRLHREEEFDGTGVGLAIVQRVVSRHGGRVWAEGKVDAGAAFYFSLPKGGADGRV